mmetsp:Transcript_16894/g.36249  ORF Transcript_16894/g.36249 Transcript_16894/m.36249 type:complete len:264 (-) Transcript_16894:392-1183(-)|eukprot:5642367-Pleurochrysis_carterae.AAC.2
MAAHRILSCLLLAARGVRAADSTKPHPHQGILQKYERKQPSAYGLSLSGISQEELRSGKPVTRLIEIDGGFKRAASIQEVPAEPEIVWSKIMDFENYPKMVEGVLKCKVYRRQKGSKGKEEVWATYRVGSGPFSMEYFMYHCIEPAKNAMTFCLDYERCSDFSDTVGYWYVEKLGDGWSRVYYSTDSQLPKWIPTFAKTKLTNLALRRSTAWVDAECRRVAGSDAACKLPSWMKVIRENSVQLVALLILVNGVAQFKMRACCG